MTTLLAAVPPAEAHVIVRPARIEATVADGALLPPIEVSNRGDAPVRIVAYTGWGGHDLSGQAQLRDDPAAREAGSRLLRLANDELYLAPGDSGRFTATVHVPEGFTGGLYPVIFLEVHPVDPGSSEGVQAIGRVAVLTLLTSGGAPDVQAEEAEVRPGRAAGTVEVAVRVRNAGSVHGLAAGSVTISDASGVPLARIPLTAGTVLPGHARELTALWLPPVAAMGPYVATVNMDAPAEQPPLQVVFTVEAAPAVAGAGGLGQ